MKKDKIGILYQASWNFDDRLYRVINGISDDTMNKPKILQDLTDIRLDVRRFIQEFMADVILNCKSKGKNNK